MANLIIQDNGKARTTPALHGEEITIQAPCDCSAVTGVQIADVVYPFYDAAGKALPSGAGLFTEGNLIRVLIDTVNTRATIINHAVTPASIGAAAASHTQAASTITAATFPATGIIAATGTDYTTARIRNIYANTTAMTAGTSSLTNGTIYLQYE